MYVLHAGFSSLDVLCLLFDAIVLGFQDNLNYGGSSSQSSSNFLHDMHGFHPQYSFGTSEVSNEYNLLNDFLTNSMLEDGGMYSNEDASTLFQTDSSFPNTMHTLSNNLFVPNAQPNQPSQMLPPSQAAIGNAISRPTSGFPIDKAREAFYMTAADPAGNDSPAERLKKLLRAKYEAGLLRPFNYVKGYARLNEYMSNNLAPQSRTRIVRQLDNFRPKFRERMQGLTDMQLTFVEIEFERRLMEYDRVFASMAIPACCWRRTGEIYRGNNEMAKLLGVPLESLRDVSYLPSTNSWHKLILRAGQDGHPRNLRRKPARQLLGEVRRHSLRCIPKGHTHKLHATDAGS
jgi:PAS domain-containing protein